MGYSKLFHDSHSKTYSPVSGCIGFMGIAVYFLTRSSNEIKAQEKLLFMLYFAGTIVCLGLSSAFHTLHCHSEWVGKLFNKYVWSACIVIMIIVLFTAKRFVNDFFPALKKYILHPLISYMYSRNRIRAVAWAKYV